MKKLKINLLSYLKNNKYFIMLIASKYACKKMEELFIK